MACSAVESDHICHRQAGAVMAGDHNHFCLQMVEQPRKDTTPLNLVEMFRWLVQRHDRAVGNPHSREVEPLRLAKRQLVLPDPSIEPASALIRTSSSTAASARQSVSSDREPTNRFARTVSSRTAASCRQSVVTARR